MHINNPLNKNWFHIANGYHLKTKHALGACIVFVLIIALKIAFIG